MADYERFEVVSGQTVSLGAGTYHNPVVYSWPGGLCEVKTEGVLKGGTVSFISNTIASQEYGYTLNGGVFYNAGTISLNDVIFNGNTAFASYKESVMYKTGDYANGGAIFNSGTATLINATLVGNNAIAINKGGGYSNCISHGGAIHNEGVLTVISASFYNNGTSAYSSRSNSSNTQGGAVFNTGVASFTDVIFNGNTTFCSYVYIAENVNCRGGAIYNQSGTIALSGATFSENTATFGGAIYNEGSISLTATVLLVTSSDTIYNAGILNWSIAGDDAGYLNDYSLLENHGTLSITVGADQATGDYILAGKAAGAAGQSFTLTGISGQSDVSLTVNGESKIYNGITYTLGVADNSLVLNGFQRIVVTTGQTVSLAAGTYTNPGYHSGSGAVSEVQQGGVLTAVGMAGNEIAFVGNTATCGGAVYIGGGSATFDNVIFDSNVACVSNAVVVSGNTVHGGAIYSQNGILSVTGSTFSNNAAADGRGGAILINGGIAMVSDSTFLDNAAKTDGGALRIYNPSVVTLSNLFLNGNTAGSHGGAVYTHGTTTLIDSTIIGNTAESSGALCNSNMLMVQGGTLCANIATSVGGALTNGVGGGGIGTTHLSGVILYGNTAGQIGGAVYNNDNGTVTLTDTIFTGNTAVQNGGGVANESGTVRVTGATFSGNTATCGGALYNNDVATLAGMVFLLTASDTIYNSENGTINWSIAGDDVGYLNDYSLLENHGTLSITVDAEQKTGNYILAGNAASAAGQSFTLTGVSGQSDVNLTVNGESKTYNALIYALKVAEDELVLTIAMTPETCVFCNSSWATNENVTVTWHDVIYTGKVGDGNFFNDYNAAKAAVATSGDDLVVMGSGTITKSTSCGAQDVTLADSDVVYSRMVLGGELQTGNHDYAGSYTISVENGTFASDFAGSDASNGNVTRTGDITVNVSGGTFAKTLSAGSYYATAGSALGTASITGTTSLNITGGTFMGRVYGGNGAMSDNFGACTTLVGNANVTINATSAIYFGECIAAGSRGHGVINGSTNVTVTGNGANLTFADTSVLFGGCSGDYYNIVGGVRTASTSVMGDRKLTFDDFTGDFGAEIRMFSDISLENSTDVNFADEKLDLKEVENWNFDCTSCATNLTKNKFTGDTISVDTTDLTASWTLLSGDAAAFADLGSATLVTLGGNTATWSGSAWSDGTYTLAVENETKLVISKLA